MEHRFAPGHASEASFHQFAVSVLELATDAIVAVDAESRILFFNPAAEALFGYRNDEIAGAPLARLVDGEAAAVHDRYVRKFLETGETVRTMAERGAVHGRRADGSRFPARASIMRIDLEGRIVLAAVVQDLTEQERLEAELRRRAYYDALTGLPNRAFFQERLEHALERMDRDGRTVAVLFLDLDGFKAVNDEHGHEMGDAVLAEVAQRFAATVRTEDTVARMGGDEFLVLLEGLSARPKAQRCAVEQAVGRIHAALEAPVQVHRHAFVLSASVGKSVYPMDGTTADALVRCADLTMYDAKADPRNDRSGSVPDPAAPGGQRE